MEFLSGFTAQRPIPAPEWAWRSASGLSNAQEDESGSNRSPEKGPRSSSRFRPEASESGAVRPVWILIVEDNPADVLLLGEAFVESEMDCEQTVIGSGEDAIAFIEKMDRERAPCPDLVLLDLKLPKRSGLEVLERIRRSAQCSAVPVVILTSSNAQEDKSAAAQLGATQYIRKPTRLDEFIRLGVLFKSILTGS